MQEQENQSIECYPSKDTTMTMDAANITQIHKSLGGVLVKYVNILDMQSSHCKCKLFGSYY